MRVARRRRARARAPFVFGRVRLDEAVTLTGKVTKVEWTNPHARFYIDVKGDDGQTTNWNLELASPNVLKRQGWASNSLKEGDVVTVEGSLARSGAKMANARVVTLADG